MMIIGAGPRAGDGAMHVTGTGLKVSLHDARSAWLNGLPPEVKAEVANAGHQAASNNQQYRSSDVPGWKFLV